MDRPRDAQGLARNDRPRDALGRPLPRGSVGVPRLPEGVVRAPADSLDLAQQLLDDGMPFHAHEVLEDAWKSAQGPEREVWRGLAQLAVGLTHAARGNVAGAASLLNRGASTLADARAHAPREVDVDGLLRWADAGAADPATVGPPRLRSAC